MEDVAIKVGDQYHWSESEINHIKNNLEEKIKKSLESETNLLRQTAYEMQLNSIEIREIVFH
jgi:cell division protein ZapA (FtsZ GTPase activity inhibitor)